MPTRGEPFILVSRSMYEHFEHTADLGLRVRAATLDELFADAARGLFAMIVTNLDSVRPAEERTYDLAGAELDFLLFDWLTELLYTCESERLLLAEFHVRVDDGGLHATCRGEPVDAARHQLEHEVKAVTYHGLKVQRTETGWLAEVIEIGRAHV